MKSKRFVLGAVLALLNLLIGGAAGGLLPLATAQNSAYPPTYTHIVGGRVIASEYGKYTVHSLNSVAAASASMTLDNCFINVGADNRKIFPFNATGAGFPYITVVDGTLTETVQLTAVVLPSVAAPSTPNPFSCAITATFGNAHAQGVTIISGDGGVNEAINDLSASGGGVVVIDPSDNVTPVQLSQINPASNVTLEDLRYSTVQYWNPLPSTASFLAAPTTLTSGTVASSTTVAGSASYTGGTIHVCIAYVDILGNEGPCSADYSFADTSAKAIVFQAPAASTGAVGWIPYIGLESGASGHEYLMPLVTQPTAIGAAPVSNGVCTLTTLETITPACAVVNASYNQATSGAVTITTYPVVTSQQALQLGGVSTTSYFAHNTNAHTTYAYVPGSHVALGGVLSSSQPFTVSAALASTVPFVLGTVAVPPSYMNYQGRALRICGQVVDAAGGINTITAIQFYWDAQGSNVTTGIPVLIGGPKITSTTSAVAYNWSFCQDIETTVASASATGGSLRATTGFLTATAIAAGTAPIAGTNIANAAVGSLNLAENARIDVVYTQTTGSTPTPQLTNLTVQVLN
jgi:stage V sporulation protein SpoVS